MKTRTLLLLALACGLAIMLAGAAFLVQLSNGTDVVAPLAPGDRASVGDMEVTVLTFQEHAGVLSAEVDIGGVDDADGSVGFRLIAAGQAVEAMLDGGPDRCVATTVEMARCVVRFDITGIDGASRVLFYERGDQRVRWLLA